MNSEFKNLSPYNSFRRPQFQRPPSYQPNTAHWVQAIREEIEPLSPVKYTEPSYTKILETRIPNIGHSMRSLCSGNSFNRYSDRFFPDHGRQTLRRQLPVISVRPTSVTKRQRPLTVFTAVAICLLGTSWQLYTLVSEFVRYEMISEVFITKDDFVKPPALSLCFPYTEVIDWSKTEEKDTPKVHPEFTRLVQEKYTVSWLLERTWPIEKLLKSSWIRKENGYGYIETEDLPPQITVTKYLKDFYVCYRFMHAKAEQESFHFRSHHISFGQRPGKLMGLTFDKPAFKPITRALIYLHDPDIYPRGDRDYPLILMANKKDVFDDDATSWGLTYTKQSLHLLPAPYATKCLNYRLEYGCENEIHCQHKCVDKMGLEQLNKSIFTVTNLRGDDNSHPTLSKYSIVNKPKEEAAVDKIIDFCNRSCPGLNCRRIYFIPQVAVKRDSEKFVVFELYDMNGPEYISWAHKKLPPISFMIGIISIIGVWMGISCKDLFLGAFTVTKKVSPFGNRVVPYS